LIPLLEDKNPYTRARVTWLLPQLGPKGIKQTEDLLGNKDEETRMVAFRSLRLSVPAILPYCLRLQNDPSPMVRREVAIALRDLPFEKTKPILLELARQYDGADRWYLEALGASLEGHEQEIYPEIKQLYSEGKAPAQWDKRMSSLAWRLHPPAALADLLARATDSGLQGRRKKIGYYRYRFYES
jgi:hypothetical protein